MQLVINDQPVLLVEMKQFRKEHNLPEEFSIRLFEDKDFDGLGRLDSGGSELNAIRHTIMEAIPGRIPLAELLTVTGNMSMLFRIKMYEINHSIGLKPVEIDFAAAGFEDVCQAFAYAVIHHKTQNVPLDFNKIYGEWLNGSVRISSTVHEFNHEGQPWQVFVLNSAYGRIGLQIKAGDEVYYVRDVSFACPAEGFMYTLLKDVTSAIFSNLS